MTSIGKTISDSVQVVSQVGREIDALCLLLQQEFSKSIEKLPNVKIANEDWIEDAQYDENEWVCTDYSCSLGLKPNGKGRKDPVGYLSVQISLAGKGMDLEGNEEPLVHICWFASAIEFEEENFIYFPIVIDEDEQLISDKEVLLNWTPEVSDWTESGWAYSFHLAAINDIDDIKTKLIAPAIALLEGEPALNALSTDMLGIIRYIAVDEKNGVFRAKPIEV